MAKKAKTWAKRLADLRKARGITLAQAAELAGVSYRAWLSWEYGQRNPSQYTARILAQAFPELTR